jgi:hypothetical protein
VEPHDREHSVYVGEIDATVSLVRIFSRFHVYFSARLSSTFGFSLPLNWFALLMSVFDRPGC